jgi:hypothetical protein
MEIQYLLPFLFPVFFVAMWVFVTFLISRLGGWSRLTPHYQAHFPFSGKRWSMRSGRMGWANYNGCLTVGGNFEGMYLAVFPLFRVGHPPLLIPWDEITTSTSKSFWFTYTDFTFSRAPSPGDPFTVVVEHGFGAGSLAGGQQCAQAQQ